MDMSQVIDASREAREWNQTADLIAAFLSPKLEA